MNIQHLKYAVEVAKTSSINKAAENLYMNQPNLSRAIKELEKSIGINIFNRTSKGISITEQGNEFLIYARNILRQIDEIENMYRDNPNKKQHFSISVPRASYISEAFVNFAKKIDDDKALEFFYKETNAYRTIDNIIKNTYNLGIIRYKKVFDEHFKILLKEKGISFELLCEFSHSIVMSKNNRESSNEYIQYNDLYGFTEIAHGDPYVPSIPISKIKREEYSETIDKRIFIFDRSSQFDLLENLPKTFIFSSPIPKDTLNKYNLVEIPYNSNDHIYKDVLIRLNEYKLTELDKLFLTELSKIKRKYFTP